MCDGLPEEPPAAQGGVSTDDLAASGGNGMAARGGRGGRRTGAPGQAVRRGDRAGGLALRGRHIQAGHRGARQVPFRAAAG